MKNTTTTTTKVTKKDHLNDLINLLAQCAEIPDVDFSGYDFNALTGFCQNEIALLEKKASKAKEAAAAKKAEKDELCEAVESVLTDEFQTRDEVTAQIEGEDVTVAKIGYRLTKLVSLGVAEKGEVTIPGSEGQKARKVVAYKLANANVSDSE